MLKNPGRWLGLWALWVFSLSLMASPVHLSVDDNPVIAGETVELTIEVEGRRAEIPDIKQIGNYPVTTEGMQRLERMDGNRTRVKWVKYYSFTPMRNVQIPPIGVRVDGQMFETAPLDIRVLPKKRRREDDFVLELNTSAAEAYVGEPVVVTVRFKESRAVPVMNVDFVPMRYEDFWVKQAGRRKTYASGRYLIHEKRYLFFPQREGNLSIGPARVKVAVTKKVRDAFGFIVQRPQWLTLESETVPLRVRPLPHDVTLVGKFTMTVTVKPRKAEAGEPVSVTVRVRAEGNIEDFTLPPLKIEGVTIYDEKPRITQRFEHGRYRGTWTKKYVLVADRSFTVPAFSFHYFDPVRNRVVGVRSEPVRVRIHAEPAEAALPATVQMKKGGETMAWLYMNMAVAFLLGMGAMYVLMRWRSRSLGKERQPRVSAGGHAQMLQRLMPHISRSKEAAQMAENLYAALFEGKAVRIDRKAFEVLMRKLASREG